MRSLKSLDFSLSVTLRPARSAALSRFATLSQAGTRSAAAFARPRNLRRMSSRRRCLSSRARGLRRDRRCRSQVAKARRPSLPSNFITSISERRCRSPIVRKPAFANRVSATLPMPQISRTGLSARKAFASAARARKSPAAYRNPRRSCEKLAIAQSNRHADPDLLLDAACETGERLGGAGAVQAIRSSQIDKGFVDRQRLDKRRQFEQKRAHFASDRAYFCISGRMTIAFGQAASALNIGIAECTP